MADIKIYKCDCCGFQDNDQYTSKRFYIKTGRWQPDIAGGAAEQIYYQFDLCPICTKKIVEQALPLLTGAVREKLLQDLHINYKEI